MAERRMFSRQVVQSSEFMTLSALAKVLYFQLGMVADDDGVAGALFVMRSLGARTRHLQELADQKFVTILSDAPLVHISHWRENNFLRKDRYRPSPYQDLLAAKGIQITPPGQPEDGDGSTQDRIGKERSGKKSKGKASSEEARQENTPATRTSPGFWERPDLASVRKYCFQRALYPVDQEAFVQRYDTICTLVDLEGDWQRVLDRWVAMCASKPLE